MTELIYFTRGIAFSCLLLVMLRTVLYYRPLLAARLLLALCLGLAAYVIVPLFSNVTWIKIPLVGLAISVPAVFWLFSDCIFDDWDAEGRKINSLRWILLLLFLIPSFFFYGMLELQATNHWMYLPLFYFSYALRISFMVLAVWAIVRQWQHDLVESRRVLRRLLLGLSGMYMLVVILVELFLGGALAVEQLEAANGIGLAIMLLLVAAWFLIVNPHDLFVTFRQSSEPITTPILVSNAERPVASTEASLSEIRVSHSEREWLRELERVIETDKGYRRADLSIGALARELKVPEHVLRRLINQHLGFRNFRDYLNRYRLQEAAARLVDPTEERLPILSIALDVGFASITPFNRAFRVHYQITPSEFRRRALQP
ncbi:MAG: helix-turn-helix domain-containing protein [Proteobacteria bacterium]|nr:helix-turn-helix domain-containing protein [Pseudomonadota bacterium]